MEERNNRESSRVTLYGLLSCTHCRRLKEWLDRRDIPYESVNVDLLVGEERSKVLKTLSRLNPAQSFPTLVIGDRVIVGYKPEEAESTWKELEARGQGV